MVTALSETLLICALVLLGIRFVLFTGVHFYHRGRVPAFTPVRTTLSEYGTGEGRPIFTAMGMVTLLAYVLITVCYGISGILGWPWLAVMGLAIWSQFMLFLFPMDIASSGERTRNGTLHTIFALTGFILFYVIIASAPLQASWGKSPWLLAWVVATHVGFWTMILTASVPTLRHFIGLAERIYLMAVPLWFLTGAALILVS